MRARKDTDETQAKAAADGDEAALALAAMPQGLYVIGSRDGDNLDGMVARNVAQVAAVPRLVAVSIDTGAHSLTNIYESGVFSVNLLADGDGPLAAKFTEPDAPRQDHRLKGVSYEPGKSTGCPILTDALAWIECRVRMTVPVGDHTLVIGRVVDGGVSDQSERG